jgi:hypothetical protein
MMIPISLIPIGSDISITHIITILTGVFPITHIGTTPVIQAVTGIHGIGILGITTHGDIQVITVIHPTTIIRGTEDIVIIIHPITIQIITAHITGKITTVLGKTNLLMPATGVRDQLMQFMEAVA